MKTKGARIVLGIATLILLIFLGAIFLFQFAGLKYYMRAVQKINLVPSEDKSLVSENFFGDKKETKIYKGILAGVNKIGLGGVWVWGRQGLRYFPAGIESKFNIIDGCSGMVIKTGVEETGIANDVGLPSEKFNNVETWSNKLQNGDYIVLASSTNAGLFNGKIINVRAYNFWIFLPVELKEQCKK